MILATNFWLLAAQINHARQFLEASGKAGACDIMSPLARLDWCCRIHSATSQSLPDRKSRRERRKRRWNRDGKSRQHGETEMKERKCVRAKKKEKRSESFQRKTSRVILTLRFSRSALETESELLTARLGGKRRTSEPFQHASLSITPSRAGTPVLAPG